LSHWGKYTRIVNPRRRRFTGLGGLGSGVWGSGATRRRGTTSTKGGGAGAAKARRRTPRAAKPRKEPPWAAGGGAPPPRRVSRRGPERACTARTARRSRDRGPRRARSMRRTERRQERRRHLSRPEQAADTFGGGHKPRPLPRPAGAAAADDCPERPTASRKTRRRQRPAAQGLVHVGCGCRRACQRCRPWLAGGGGAWRHGGHAWPFGRARPLLLGDRG
jgi:hypothetical protein